MLHTICCPFPKHFMNACLLWCSMSMLLHRDSVPVAEWVVCAKHERDCIRIITRALNCGLYLRHFPPAPHPVFHNTKHLVMVAL